MRLIWLAGALQHPLHRTQGIQDSATPAPSSARVRAAPLRQLHKSLEAGQRRLQLVAGNGQELVHAAIGLAQRQLVGLRLGAFAQQMIALDNHGRELRHGPSQRNLLRREGVLGPGVVEREGAHQVRADAHRATSTVRIPKGLG